MQTKPHLSLQIQAIYVILTGLQLIFIPNSLLGMFGMPATTEVWIKVLGIVILPLSAVYYAISRHGSKSAARATVFSRMFVGVGFITLYLAGQAPVSIILFAGIDIFTAIITVLELRSRE